MQQASYRSGRLTAFLDPWKDPTGVGYHTIQALLALGSGGLFGKGLGNSIQKDVLPAPHTDSILAIIGEEFGLLGTLLVLALFVIIAYRGMRIAMRAPDGFGRLLAAGITSWITLQALMNFAVITSSVPFTGVPLPFVSYGGTSMIIGMAAFGILMNISRHSTGEGFARAHLDNRRGHRRTRLPRVVGHPTPQGRDSGAADGEAIRRHSRRVGPGRRRLAGVTDHSNPPVG
jgi:cell division protein FtsW (lipid II flippase)